MSNPAEITKGSVDAVSVAVALGTVAEWLPSIAALFTIIWTGLRIYEWIEGGRAAKRRTSG